VSSDNRGSKDLLVAAHPQAHAASAQSFSSQQSPYCSDLLDELKENISPLRSKPAGTGELQNVVTKNVVDCEKVGSHLLIVEDMGTPLRRTTFVRDADRCSPKCVTRTPERRIVSIDGFQSNSSFPKAVPDCYATPLRRTTFVKNSPKLELACGRCGHVESALLVGKLQRNSERNVVRSVETGVKPHVLLESVPDNFSKATCKSCRQHLKSDSPLRDVSRSPLILEDRLLRLQDTSQSDRPNVERSRSVASSRCSPNESEYHTAVTTPYDESLSENEDADIFLDSNICSETITGDMSLCQQQIALQASCDVLLISDDDTEMKHNGIDGLSKKMPSTRPCIDCQQVEVVMTTVSDEYDVHTEVVQELLMSEAYVTEMISSSHASEAKHKSAVVYECEVADFEHLGNVQQLLHSAVRADDIQHNANTFSSDCMSSLSGDPFSATGFESYKRLSSTPLLNHEKLSGTAAPNHSSIPTDSKLPPAVANDVLVAFHEHPSPSEKVHVLSHIPFENDTSCSFNSQTFTKICATPSFTAGVAEDTGSYNRTYTKSANGKSIVNSGSRPASRPLFTDSTGGINSTEDESAGVVPLDAIQSAFCDTATAWPETYKPNHQPEPERAKRNEPVQLSSVWTDSDAYIVDSDVFSCVGGQTRHMISPGQKRQSLIARLHGDRQQHTTQSAAAAISVGHCKREHLARDGSPVRKRPHMATFKPREYCS